MTRTPGTHVSEWAEFVGERVPETESVGERVLESLSRDESRDSPWSEDST